MDGKNEVIDGKKEKWSVVFCRHSKEIK